MEKINFKLSVKNYHDAYYEVNNKKFYSKVHAINECLLTNWEWPTFRVWSQSYDLKRPIINFKKSCDRQVELLQDTSKKIRVWFSGGRDSTEVLDCFLRNNARLDEIAIYRRWPGGRQHNVNEFDLYNVESNLKKILNHYQKNINVKFYEIEEEHFLHFSNNLEETYFPYTLPQFFSHHIYPVTQVYPDIITDGYTNIAGMGVPEIDNEGRMCWSDGHFNLSFMDPNTVNFFCDERNKDVATNLAYVIKDMNDPQYRNRNYLNLKNFLNFQKLNTELDNAYNSSVEAKNSPYFRWISDIKDLRFIVAAGYSEVGQQTLRNFFTFYEDAEKKYKKYLSGRSIYHQWIGSVSEKHKLLD